MALTIGGRITVGPGVTVASETGRAVAVALANTPWIYAWRWTNTGGWGAAYTSPTIAEDLNNCEGMDFHPAGNAVALTGDRSPYILAWQWSSLTGFGTRYTSPSDGLNVIGNTIKFNRAGNVVAGGSVTSTSNINIFAYAWSSSGFGTKFTDPATNINSNQVQEIAFSPTDQAIIYSVSTQGTTNSGIKAVRWNNSTGFGSAYSQPATYADFVGTMLGMAINPSGTAVAATGPNTTTSCYAWPWNDDTGFGTRYSNPASIQAGHSRGVRWSPSGKSIAVVYDASPYIAAWAWTDDAGFGSRFSNPSTLPVGPTYSVTFNFEGNVVFISGRDAAVEAYSWSDSTGFGTKFAAPATAPNSNSWSVTVCP